MKMMARMLGLMVMVMVSAAGPRAAETLKADKISTITLAASTAELTTAGTINRTWWGQVPLKNVAETVAAAWLFSGGLTASQVNVDNVRLDGQAVSTVSGALALEPYLLNNLTIGDTTGKHVAIVRSSEDVAVQWKSGSTVLFEFRSDNGIFELNRGADTTNAMAFSGSSIGIGDALPDAPLEVVGNFFVSATADGDGNNLKVVSGVTTAANLALTNTGTFLRGDSWTSKTVSYGDSFPVAVATVADGYMVDAVIVQVTVAFDGSDNTFIVGDGVDGAGFATFDAATPGYYGSVAEAEMGLYLQAATSKARLCKVYSAADTVDAYIDTIGGAQGTAIVWTHVSRLK